MQKMKCLALPLCLVMVLVTAAGSFGAERKRYERTEKTYAIPDVTLIDQNRKQVKLAEFLDTDKPVVLDFIFCSCTTICPVLSAGFTNFQKKLGPEAEKVRMVSITIDPEHDTPEVLSEYSQRYGARPGWTFLTGSREDIDHVMRAFDAYVPDKMSHYPLTFLRAPGGGNWVRIYGLVGTADLLEEFRALQQ